MVVALSAGCYKLNFENGQLRCSVPDNKCPSGYHCATDGYCWKNGQDPTSTISSGHPGSSTVGASVTASSANYKVIMSLGQSPGGNGSASSPSYHAATGVVGATQGK